MIRSFKLSSWYWRNIILYYLKAEQQHAAKIYLEDMAKTLVYVRMMIRGDDVSEELDGVQFYRAPLPAGFTFMNLTPPVHPDEVLMKAEIKQCVNFMLRFKRLHAHWATLGNQYSNAEPSAHEAAGGDTTTANHEEADEEDDLPPTAPWLRRQQLRQTERKLEAEGVEPKEEANESAEETKAVKKKRKREKDNGKAKKPSEVEEPEEQAQPVEHERHYTETEQKVEAAEHDTEDEDKGNSDKAKEKKQDWCFRGRDLRTLRKSLEVACDGLKNLEDKLNRR
ncbi:unnamed protein product [Durusdinium trenchii]|uniref:Uncharacterized protein n=1 Tax=Durusdinium trenchii TaxID=1381693 RepID=A0ABP0RMX5_9DINO